MDVNDMVNELLSKKWLKFEDLFKDNDDNKCEKDGDLSCPGVYILAYINKNIEGEAIRVNDIYYVGMSNSRGGLRQRLKQFERGIYHGDRHSAARRQYKDKAGGKPYNETREKDGKRFYVAYFSLKCKVNKDEREKDDLEKMGQIAMLEYYVLAYIREKKGREPDLNKK